MSEKTAIPKRHRKALLALAKQWEAEANRLYDAEQDDIDEDDEAMAALNEEYEDVSLSDIFCRCAHALRKAIGAVGP